MAMNTRRVHTRGLVRSARTTAVLMTGAFSVAMLAGCSGSTTTSTNGASSSTTAAGSATGGTTSTSAAPGTSTSAAPGTSTTVKPSPQAAAATLVVADLAGEWKDYPTEKGVVGEGAADSCKELGSPSPPLDPSMETSGHILQRGDRNVFLQSTSWVFPDAKAAADFAQRRLSKEFAECRRAQLEANVADRQPKMVVELDQIQPSDHTKAYQGLVSFNLGTVVDGAKQLNGSSRHLVYLKGSTVIDVFDQYGALAGDPSDLTEKENAEMTAAMDKVIARVAG